MWYTLVYIEEIGVLDGKPLVSQLPGTERNRSGGA